MVKPKHVHVYVTISMYIMLKLKFQNLFQKVKINITINSQSDLIISELVLKPIGLSLKHFIIVEKYQQYHHY